MIRLNRIFGKKPVDDPMSETAAEAAGPGPGVLPLSDPGFEQRLRRAVLDPGDCDPMPVMQDLPCVTTGPAPHPAPLPEEWDEAFADDYLTGQEQAFVPPPHEGSAAWPPADTIAASLPIPSPPAPEPLATPALLQIHEPLDLSTAAFADPGRGGRRAGRVKTRLLGFDSTPGLAADPIDAARGQVPITTAAPPDRCPTGWIVVVKGPGRGAHFPIFTGVFQIGRGEDQAIKLDFGDSSISRSNHAAIAYDDEQNSFFLGHGGKTNLIRLNDRPVISTEPLAHHDRIRIGETTLLFVALCADGFRWDDADGPDDLG